MMATDTHPPLDGCIAGRHTDTALEVRGGGRMPWPGPLRTVRARGHREWSTPIAATTVRSDVLSSTCAASSC